MNSRIIIGSILLLLTTNSFSQYQLKGKIFSHDGVPVENANVQIQENRKTTTSDQHGIFVFDNLAEGTYTIISSYTGLTTKIQKVVLASSNNELTAIYLQQNQAELQEVLVNSRKSINNQKIDIGKLEADPLDLPQSISVINKSLIADQQSQKLSDVIRNVNGVYMAGARAGTQETFYARGYNFGTGNMFKNGSRINTTSFPEMSSLEKVEILKGSAAILYGNVAPGGIVNMITKQPKFNKGGEVSLRLAEYGLVKPAVDYYAPISKNIAFRINGTYEKANSFRDVVKTEKFYVNPSLLFKMGNRTELLLQGDYMNHHFTPDFGIGSLADTLLASVPRNRFMGTNWQYNRVVQSTASAQLKHKLSENWKLTGNLSYHNFDRDYFGVERIQAKANGNWARPLGKILSNEDYYSSTIDLNGKFKTGKIEHNLLAGADADRYYTTNNTFDVQGKIYDTINLLHPEKFLRRTDIPVATALTKTVAPINRMGAYIQDLIQLSPKFKLLAGIRYSIQNTKGVWTRHLAKDSVSIGVSNSVDAFSPRVGLVYRPVKNLSAFASYSNSFILNTGTDVNGNSLPPSLIDQYELGIKNEFFNGKLSANITVYKIINNNLAQTAPFLADGITQNSNTNIKELAGQTTSKGFEIDMQSNPVMGLNIMAGFSHNDMRYTKTGNAKGNYFVGDRLVNTPANTANFSTFFTKPNGPLRGLKLGLSALYIGERFAGWNNTVGQAQNYNRTFFVDDFATVDLSAGYTFNKITVLGKLGNIFNEYNYYVHENYSVNPIAPRMFTATVTYKF